MFTVKMTYITTIWTLLRRVNSMFALQLVGERKYSIQTQPYRGGA